MSDANDNAHRFRTLLTSLESSAWHVAPGTPVDLSASRGTVVRRPGQPIPMACVADMIMVGVVAKIIKAADEAAPFPDTVAVGAEQTRAGGIQLLVGDIVP